MRLTVNVQAQLTQLAREAVDSRLDDFEHVRTIQCTLFRLNIRVRIVAGNARVGLRETSYSSHGEHVVNVSRETTVQSSAFRGGGGGVSKLLGASLHMTYTTVAVTINKMPRKSTCPKGKVHAVELVCYA